ncbi:MAG TPA: sulfatase-like hydrolase/transferase [Firmicutes bacterium]|nr:sulfatase-like hydrolase/transferase [Bacillota bacterium]
MVKRVVMIMWDAFGTAFYERFKELPHLSRLRRMATCYVACEGIYPSVTNVVWTSMMTGAYPEKTGNLAYYWDRRRNVVRGLHREYTLENLVESLARGGRTSGSVGMFMLLRHGLHWEHEGGAGRLYIQPPPDFTVRVKETIRLYRGEYGYKPEFITVYTAVLDSLAHQVGPNDPRIDQLIMHLDEGLGSLLDAIAADPDGADTAVVLTGDHGASEARYGLRDTVNACISSCGHVVSWMSVNESVLADAEIVAVSAGRTAALYFVQKHVGTTTRDFTMAEKYELQQRLATIPGVAAVLDPEALQDLRTDLRLADLLLEAEVPYAFWAQTPESMRGTHGSRLEMDVPLLIAVPGVPAAERSGARIVDIAPTIADLLGAPKPCGAQGRVLALGPQTGEVLPEVNHSVP